MVSACMYTYSTTVTYMLIFLSTLSDIDECTTDTHTCDENADCSNTVGSFTCSCRSGYSGNGEMCDG